MDTIVASRKPLIVHNGMLDLMHIYLRCIDELPPDWSTYRNKVSQLFPYLFDNKYLFANSPTLNSKTDKNITSLSSCFTAMRKEEDSSSVKV